MIDCTTAGDQLARGLPDNSSGLSSTRNDRFASSIHLRASLSTRYFARADAVRFKKLSREERHEGQCGTCGRLLEALSLNRILMIGQSRSHRKDVSNGYRS